MTRSSCGMTKLVETPLVSPGRKIIQRYFQTCCVPLFLYIFLFFLDVVDTGFLNPSHFQILFYVPPVSRVIIFISIFIFFRNGVETKRKR